MANYILPYGNKNIKINIPENKVVLYGKPKENKQWVNVEEQIEEKLENPIDSPPLSQWARLNDDIAIICDDYTRPTPAAIILKVVLKIFKKVGINNEQIKIVISGGLHRKMNDTELRSKLGDFVIDQYRIIQHDSFDESQLR